MIYEYQGVYGGISKMMQIIKEQILNQLKLK